MYKFAVLFFILCFAWVGVSQNETYKFNHITSTEGLSQSSAITICQDNTSLIDNSTRIIKELSNKELWVGTRSGLSIYNNSTDSFKSFLSGKQILSVFEIHGTGYILLKQMKERKKH